MTRVGPKAALPAVLASILALAGSATAGSLDVAVENGAGSERLRCVIQLAHWMSEETPAIAPGGAVDLALENRPATGEVIMRNSLGRPMAVEGMYCFFGGGPSPTRAVVAIDAVRRAARPLVIVCRNTSEPSCEVNERAD